MSEILQKWAEFKESHDPATCSAARFRRGLVDVLDLVVAEIAAVPVPAAEGGDVGERIANAVEVLAAAPSHTRILGQIGNLMGLHVAPVIYDLPDVVRGPLAAVCAMVGVQLPEPPQVPAPAASDLSSQVLSDIHPAALPEGTATAAPSAQTPVSAAPLVPEPPTGEGDQVGERRARTKRQPVGPS